MLDDLHWADRADAAPAAARRPGAAAGLAAHRRAPTGSREFGRDHPLAELLADLRRERLFERVPLDGLDERRVGELIASHAGYEAPPGSSSTVLEHTEGNPFFVEEVMRHLIETGVLFERDGRWSPP